MLPLLPPVPPVVLHDLGLFLQVLLVPHLQSEDRAMTNTHYRRDPVSLLGFSASRTFEPWWGVDAQCYRTPWLQYTFWLGLGRLRLVLRVHLPWVKP